VPLDKEVKIHIGVFDNDKFDTVFSKVFVSKDFVQPIKIEIPIYATTRLFHIYSDKGINKAEFLYSPKEKDILVEANYYGLKNGDIEISNSIENVAYSEMIKVQTEFNLYRDSIMEESKLYSVFNHDFKSKIIEHENKVELLQHRLNLNLEKIQIKYPETFTSITLIPIAKIPIRHYSNEWSKYYDSYLSFLNEKFFNFIDFNNAELLNHYALSEKIKEYLINYVERNQDHTQKGIDVIMSRLKTNEKVNSYVFNFLLKTFIEVKSEYFVNYLTKNYSAGCSLNLSMDDLIKLSSITVTSIGAKAPDILLYDNKHSAKSLYETVKKNDITIVFFWVSWCERCKKEIPALKEVYDIYKKKKVEIYAVSLDEKEVNWNEALNQYKTNWINVAELVEIKKSKYAKEYNLSTTPTILILDKEGKIIAKNLFGEELKAFLDKHFN